jgi:hypothetical protein
MFRAMFSSIIRSIWLYLQHLVVFTQVAAGWTAALPPSHADCVEIWKPQPAGTLFTPDKRALNLFLGSFYVGLCQFKYSPILQQDIQYAYKSTVEARLRNHLCRGKAVSVNTFWVCVCSLGYLACKAHEIYCTAIYGLSGSTVLFHIISWTARFSGGGGLDWTSNVNFGFLYNFCLKRFSF